MTGRRELQTKEKTPRWERTRYIPGAREKHTIVKEAEDEAGEVAQAILGSR